MSFVSTSKITDFHEIFVRIFFYDETLQPPAFKFPTTCDEKMAESENDIKSSNNLRETGSVCDRKHISSVTV